MRPANNALVALDRWILSLRWRDKFPLILITTLAVSGIVGWMTMRSAVGLIVVPSEPTASNPVPWTVYSLNPQFTPNPEFPPWERMGVVEATVQVWVTMNDDGTVRNVQGAWGTSTPGWLFFRKFNEFRIRPFQKAAREAAARWRFEPSGIIPRTVQIDFEFGSDNQSASRAVVSD